MIGLSRCRAAVLLAAILGLGVTCLGWLVLWSHEGNDEAFQLRLSQWGGRSQPLPNPDSPLKLLRGPLGDGLYTTLVGSMGRVVAAHRAGATREQLADLLNVQPICTAYVAGMKAVDDGWVSGIRDRRAIMGLILDGTGVTDRSTDAILEMTKLEQLGLSDTAISDEAVARLLKLPSLGRLMVGGPNIRAIRLVEHAVVDGQGLPASRSGETLSVRGRIAVSGLSGTLGKAHVMIRAEGDRPPWESFPYGWNASQDIAGSMSQDSPGIWSLDVPLSNIPRGKLTAEVWVDFIEAGGSKKIVYRLQPFSIDLAPPTE